ncbi:MAG: hypothetical protein FJ029_01610 [Actinobacteria bacterium]|nr:hypothetical protein [Actinomycetota bacterium]
MAGTTWWRWLGRLTRSEWSGPLLIVALGLAPLFWAPLDVLLLSEDAALPRPPSQFPLALHSWNAVLNTGTPHNVAHPALLLFGQQALLQQLGLGMALTQRLIAVLWFTLPGLSLWFLMRTLFRLALAGRPWRTAALVAVSFYMFNLYLENLWLGFNIAVLSAQAALPALLALFVLAFERRLGLVGLALSVTPVALWASSIGVNPPMLFVFVGAVMVFVIAYGLLRGAWRSLRQLRRMAAVLGMAVAVGLSVNAFWLVPFVGQLRATTGADITTASQLAASWLTGVSASTSLENVVRFQGDWTWYQGWQEPYRPHSELYRTNGGLLALGWIAPGLALLGALAPGPRLRHVFTLLAAGGLLLSMGPHAPMEPIYSWLVEHVPFFWIVRSPWFKFTLVTALGYAVLIGFGLTALVRCGGWLWHRVGQRGKPPAALALGASAIAMGLNLAYAYPVTTGQMFVPPTERRFLNPNQARVPRIAQAASRWYDAQSGDFRVAALPETTVWATEWGFDGRAPALTQMGVTPVVYAFETIAGSLTDAANVDLNKVAYRALYRAMTRRVDEIFKLMSVRYVNHETDVKYWLYAADTDSPEWVRSRLALQLGVTPVARYGRWDVYATQTWLPRIYLAPSLTVVTGGLDALPPLVGSPQLAQPALAFSEQQPPGQLADALKSPLLGGVALFASGPAQLALDALPAAYRHPLPKPGTPLTIVLPAADRYALLLRARHRGVFPSGELALDGVPLDVPQSALSEAPFWIELDVRALAAGSHRLTGALDETAAAEFVAVPQGELARLAAEVQHQLARPAVPVTLLATSELGARHTAALPDASAADGVAIRLGEPFSAPETLPDGTKWRWLEATNAERALVVVNPTEREVYANVLFTVQSHLRSRGLYVFVGDRQLSVWNVPGGRPTEVVLHDLPLKPGETVLRLYTPFPGSEVGGKQLTFGLLEGSAHAGRLQFLFPLTVRQSGRHRLEVRAYGPEAAVEALAATLNGRPLAMQPASILGETTFVAEIELMAGEHEFAVTQSAAEQYAMRLLPEGLGDDRSSAPAAVQVLEAGPTNYRVRASTQGPAVLVFGDSFDPRWEARLAGQALTHHVINGFGNGFEIPGAGTHEIVIEYRGQRLFVWGAAVTLTALAGLVVLGAARRGMLRRFMARSTAR